MSVAAWLIAAIVLAAGAIWPTAGTAHGRALYVANGASGSRGTIWQASVRVPGGRPSPLAPPTIATAEDPKHIAVTEDGRFAYATGTGDGLIYAYAVRSGAGRLASLGSPVSAGLGAHGVAVSPDDRSAYVASQDSGAVFQYDVNRRSGVLTPKSPASIASGPGASGVAITPNGRSVYVTNLETGSISQYDVDRRTGALAPKDPPTVRTPASPGGVGVSPDGRSLYVATLSGRLAQFTIQPRSGVLRPKRPATVRVGLGASGVATTPDGRFVYVPNAGTDSVSQFAVDRAGGRLKALSPSTVPAGDQPEGVAVTPDGRALYVENAAAGTTSWFRIGSGSGRLRASGRTIDSGPSPHGAAVTPDQGPRARLRVAEGDRIVRVGEPVALSGAKSRDPDGSIGSYRWSFGDGRKQPDGKATARHRYRRPGRYTVRLTVTDNEGCSTKFLYTGQTASCNGGRPAIALRRITVRGRG